MDDYQKNIHFSSFDCTWEITSEKHGCVIATFSWRTQDVIEGMKVVDGPKSLLEEFQV